MDLSLKTVRLVYGGVVANIRYFGEPNYDSIIAKALDQFNISRSFVDSIQISNGFDFIFPKNYFEKFISIAPKRNFYILLNGKNFDDSSVGSENSSQDETRSMVVHRKKRRPPFESLDDCSDGSSDSDDKSGPMVINVKKRRLLLAASSSSCGDISDESLAARLRISKQIDETMKRLAKRRRSALKD